MCIRDRLQVGDMSLEMPEGDDARLQLRARLTLPLLRLLGVL